MARRVFLILLVVGVALAQTPAEPTGLRESGCFNCHETGGGSFGPPLTQMYAVLTPVNLSLPEGEVLEYDVEVYNTWTAELSAIHGIMDLESAPSLGFVADQPPTHEEKAAALPMGIDRRADVTLDMPVGATDAVFRISSAQPLLAPDLVLNVWPPGSNVETDDPFTVDANGAGGAESFKLKGGFAIAALGFGPWIVEAQEVVTDLPASTLPQDITFELDTWSNVSAERQQVTATDSILDGQDKVSVQSALLTWRLRAESPPGPDERINITINATAFYAHPGTTSGGLDLWHYTKTTSVGVYEDRESPEVTVIDAGERDEIEPLKAGIPWDRIGEIIGYVSAFLLILSVVTGGIFGKRSRRGLNKIFKSAKRRVAFHNFVSYLLTFFAVAHTVLFIVEPGYPWTLGMIWGGIALLAMILLGVTGALQVPMIRKWDYASWRWTHLGLAIASLVFTVIHLLLDGANFTEFAAWVGWQDPFQ